METTGSESQAGGMESTYSLAEGELLAPRASLSAIVLYALGICMILKLEMKVLLRQNSSMCLAKAGQSLGDDHLHQLRTIRRKNYC